MQAVVRLFLQLCLFACPAFAQALPQGIVTGQVTERLSGQPVAQAKLIIESNNETLTDNTGRFRLELAPGSYRARIEANGYATQALGTLNLTPNFVTTLDIKLDLAQITDATTVSAGFNLPTIDQPVSTTTLRRNELRQMPGTAGDVLRALSSLPGATAVSSQFGDLLVRGGLPSENLTFIDNIPLADFTYFNDQYDSNARGGRSAVIAPDVFDRLEFSAGGFGARYGDKLSSALDVTLRAANRDRWQGSAFADFGIAGASFEIPINERASWFTSVRRSYIDLAFKILNLGTIGRPRNWDLVNKLSYDVTPRHKLNVTSLILTERYTEPLAAALRDEDPREQLIADRGSQRYVVGATLSSTLGGKALSNLTAWGIGDHNSGSFVRTFNDILQRTRDLREAQFGLKEEFTASVSPRLNLAAGGGVIVQQGKAFTFERAGAGFSWIGEEARAPTRNNLLKFGNTANGYGYAQLQYQLLGRLAVTPGARVDHYGLLAQTLFSPRLSARLRLLRNVALNLAAGRYYQPPSTFVLSLTSRNRTLKAQRADHFIAGLEWTPSENWRVTIEGYQKYYAHALAQITRETGNFYNSASGSVRGLEINAQRAFTGRWTLQTSYAYVHARRRWRNGFPLVPLDVVRPHQFTVIGITSFKGFTIAPKLRVASGLPFTRLTPVPFFERLFFLWELRNQADRNAASFNRFLQVDLRVERKFNFKRWSIAPYADMFNLTKHRNEFQVNYLPNGRLDTTGERTLLPLVGVRIEF
jgi:outer membrane receptor protein involved in Fe transport